MTDGSPAVSVLVTVYNREAYLEKTLRSILASSFADLEVIVADDCSTDSSATIAQNLAKEDNRIRFVKNETNLGDYGNRMRSASMARGTFLKYVDSDDLIYPHTLQVMVDSMQCHADAVVGLAHSMPEDDQPYPWKLQPQAAYQKHFAGRGCLSCGPTGAIIRRDAFEASGGFRKEWGVLSDTDLWLRLAANAPIVLLPPGLVWWRRHDDQEFTKGDAMEVYLQRGHDLDIAALNANDCPLNESDRRAAIARRKQHYARRLLALGTRQKRPGLAAGLFRKSKLSFFDLLRGLQRYQ